MRWCVLVVALSACAEPALSASCTSCGVRRDDGLDVLWADPRVRAAEARRSPYLARARSAREAANGAEDDVARDEHVAIARLYLLAAIAEEERLALAPPVEREGRLEVDRATRLEAAREDAAAIVARNLAEATTDEERRLRATATERRGTRAQAAAMLATACEEAIVGASAALPPARVAELRSRLSSALAQRDLDARYVALDQLAIDVREAMRAPAP